MNDLIACAFAPSKGLLHVCTESEQRPIGKLAHPSTLPPSVMGAGMSCRETGGEGEFHDE